MIKGAPLKRPNNKLKKVPLGISKISSKLFFTFPFLLFEFRYSSAGMGVASK